MAKYYQVPNVTAHMSYKSLKLKYRGKVGAIQS
jgi:hypothetical protein